MTKALKILFLPLLLLIFTACENNIEVIKNLTKNRDLPSVKAQNMEIFYSDSGRVKIKIIAKELDVYDLPEKKYKEFPKGILLYEYDSAMNVTASIQANYALYHEKEKLWEARSNVVAKNFVKNQEIYTEELFWDQPKAKIYSSKFAKIVDQNGTVYGEEGFTANQDLSFYHLNNIKGNFNIEDDSTQTNP